MEKLEQAKQSAIDLTWLATLLTGCRETAADVTVQAIVPSDHSNGFFSCFMHEWARRIVIGKALAAVRSDLAQSARRTAARRSERCELPPRSWVLDEETTKLDLERALLPIDVFPRAAVLLLAFEGVPLKDAAILLNAEQDLVRTALAAGLRDLTINLARMQGWEPGAIKSNTAISGRQHVCTTRTSS